MMTMTNKKNDRYTDEFKATTIQRMMPPKNEGVRQLSEELGVPEAIPSFVQVSRTFL